MIDPFATHPMCRRFQLAVVTLLLATSASPLHGQTVSEAAVREVVERLFEGMRRGDSAAVRSVFHPQARMLTATVRDGSLLLQSGDVDDFVRAVGTPHDRSWDERIAGLEMRVDDPLATAWMQYRFHLGDTFSHCGVNSMQLVRGDDGWQVLQIVDTRRRSCAE